MKNARTPATRRAKGATAKKAASVAPPAPADAVVERLGRIADAMERIADSMKNQDGMPVLMTIEQVAEWMEMNLTTFKLHVLTRPGFPAPFRPTGKEQGQKRYFRDEVIAFARMSRGTNDDDALPGEAAKAE